jgi:hypothetical protein
MKKIIGLLIYTLFAAGVTAANGLYEPINFAELAAHPEAYHGRPVEITAAIIAIGADGNRLELFDRQSRTMVTVRLALLPESQRSALIFGFASSLLVQGRATVIAGRLVIDADKAEALPLESADSRQSASGASAVVSLSSAF